jgi:hypothetical protein
VEEPSTASIADIGNSLSVPRGGNAFLRRARRSSQQCGRAMEDLSKGDRHLYSAVAEGS